MTCEIERVLTPGGFVVLRVSGRIDGTNIEALRQLAQKEKTMEGRPAIDLTDVTMVSQEAVEALPVAEAERNRNCPAYVREWVYRKQERVTPE
jgi:anti-anti-sigma regulatory factor